MAGSEEQSPSMTTGQLVSLIQQVGRTAIERDSLYHPIKVFEKGELAEDTKRSYYQLPVN